MQDDKPVTDTELSSVIDEIPAKPGSYQALINTITPEIRARLQQAIELGKWESGERLSPAQLEHCLQALIAWDHKNLPPEQRVAFIDRSKSGKGTAKDKDEDKDQRKA